MAAPIGAHVIDIPSDRTENSFRTSHDVVEITEPTSTVSINGDTNAKDLIIYAYAIEILGNINAERVLLIAKTITFKWDISVTTNKAEEYANSRNRIEQDGTISRNRGGTYSSRGGPLHSSHNLFPPEEGREEKIQEIIKTFKNPSSTEEKTSH